MSETKLTVRPFLLGSDKEAALKPLEEAAEVYGAWQVYETTHESNNTIMDAWLVQDIADEIADVIQAASNLAFRYGIDLQDAMDRCERRNIARGRYE